MLKNFEYEHSNHYVIVGIIFAKYNLMEKSTVVMNFYLMH